MWLVHNFVRTLLTIQCMHFGQLSQLSFAQTIDSKLSLNGIKALKILCPEVDICIRDASGPMVRPNRILDNGIFVSICHGCSCHEDCHDMLTCCFPGDMDTGNDAAASTSLESHSVDSNTTSPSILDNSLDHNLATSENHLNTSHLETDQSFISDNTSAVVGHIAGDAPVSTSQCLFARTGDAEGSWNENIPAYRMVSKAPSDGCIPDAQMKQDVREGAGPVAPWGDLYPVYSSKHGTIYKNALYARCHGTYDYVHMTATLACDHVDEQTGRVISVADHFTFLQQKSISPYCFITFDYKESAMLTDNRCFVDTVASCPITYSNDSFRIPDGVNITHTEVRNACYSGLHAPILLDVVYRNVFCAVCNNLVPDVNYLQKKSFTDPSDKHFQRKTTYLLDVSFLLENEDTIDSLETTVGYSEVCLPVDKEQGTESCRRLSCPSGQVRDKAGVCRYPFKTWYRGVFSVTVKLVYINKNISVNDILDAGLQRADDIYHGFLSSSPWPSRWEIVGLVHSSEDTHTGSSIALELVAATTKPSHVLQTIRIAIARPWILSLNGTNIPFRQSLFEFSFTRESFRFFPAWQPYIDLLGPALKDYGAPFLTWRVIHSTFSMYAYPYQVTKLFTCEAVSLLDGEYTLMANNLVLINKLTGSVMFDKEFELHEHENGQLIPHVCLSDTSLRLKSQSTNNQAVSCLTLPILMLVCTFVTF